MTHAPDPSRSGLHVKMIVQNRTVNVQRRLQVHAAAERPHADDDESGADESFAPPGNHVDRWQGVAEKHGEQRDEHDTGRVADTPGPPCDPPAAAAVSRQRRHGRQMVWSRKDVKETGQGAGDGDKHVVDELTN